MDINELPRDNTCIMRYMHYDKILYWRNQKLFNLLFYRHEPYCSNGHKNFKRLIIISFPRNGLKFAQEKLEKLQCVSCVSISTLDIKNLW